jgi:hypothetical protein
MSTKRSEYEQFLLQSNNKKTVDIRLGVSSFDYYEDIFSPTVTAKVLVANTGETVPGQDGRFQSLYNGLPLRGGERLSIKIKPNSETNPTFDFSQLESYFYVSSISNVISESQREFFTLNLVSREAITNETSRVGQKFPTGSPISASAKTIISKYLKTEKAFTVDDTQNQYGFIGNLRKPYTVLVWLASKSVPVPVGESGSATAGFVFYQTQDGLQFRALDNLLQQQSKATYEYVQVNESSITRNNDRFIISYTTERNQNLIEKLRLGTYASYRTFYDPLTFKFTPQEQAVFKLDNYVKNVKNLGQNLELPDGLGNTPTRIITRVLDIGTMEEGVSTQPNANPFLYQSQAIMRYNILFTQILSMTVPLNTNLRAGDIITCEFPLISQDNKQVFDEQQSGLYMIKELCHHFDTEASYTSMKLIRDTFGKYGTNNK